MNRETLLRCSVFASLTGEEAAQLLNCLDGKYKALGNNCALSLDADSVAFLVCGEASVQPPCAAPFSAARGDAVAGRCMLTAKTRCECVVLRRTRLLSLCRNACACHRRALMNYALLRVEPPSTAAAPPR
ncbi:MAG: hypothetical protein VB092_07895 [Oscillospiraceae bacterium]|nr:hypothetical protein [Oscillospiraceae bacterium]